MRRSWALAATVTGALALGALALPLGVPTTVSPPARPSEPTPVFLVDYGRTPALVLTVDQRSMIAYVYGDWNYYALRRQGVLDSIAALSWPTQGGLGRKQITGPPTIETVRQGIGIEVEAIHAFHVERHAIERLRRELDRVHHEQLDTAVSSYGMTFVHHPEPYTYWSNSNHKTAAWMKALGCEIRGPSFGSRWRVRNAKPPSSPSGQAPTGT